ncbi:MAG: tetratricopeptide repeat protein [Cyanobacteria bacterium J06634_6]
MIQKLLRWPLSFLLCCVLLLGSLTAFVTPAAAVDLSGFAGLKSGLTRAAAEQDWGSIGLLRKAAFAATQAGQFEVAEEKWSELINQLPEEAAVWSNRGNVRVRRNNLDGAMADYSKAIALAPAEPDPYLNRGAVWEAMGQWENAIADYNRVLQLNPDDPAAYNNRGNAEAGLDEWELAIADYQAAITLQPSFSLAYGNYALALYQTGEQPRSLQIMKSLVRKYPNFVDMRAALTAALWDAGQRGEAESNWVAVVGLDTRYKDLNWVRNVRRWPPKITTALEHFLSL